MLDSAKVQFVRSSFAPRRQFGFFLEVSCSSAPWRRSAQRFGAFSNVSCWSRFINILVKRGDQENIQDQKQWKGDMPDKEIQELHLLGHNPMLSKLRKEGFNKDMDYMHQNPPETHILGVLEVT
ncbi:hypothetical protein NL676_024416 [Syzygium grande]|nr:hypothetical protein NL676_024416 [Syzygium grande]